MDWQRLRDLVEQAEDIPAGEREAFLRKACGTDEDLFEEAWAIAAPDDDELPDLELYGPDPERLADGVRVGKFNIVAFLDEGGMGEVYDGARAEDDYQQRVAIKVMGAKGLHSKELRKRFLSERQLLADLGEHPNIAGILDGGLTQDGRPFMAMEKVEGRPIDVFCREQDLDVNARLDLFLRVCDAVRFAHARLVVHRDIKPANILVTDDGVPKLIDFGIAKDLGKKHRTPKTVLGTLGTIEYASPEHLTAGPITTASDVYSLGVVLYELLTDHNPFMETGPDRLAGRTEADMPAPPSADKELPSELRRSLAGDLDHVVLRAMAPDPDKRYASVEELQREIRQFLAGRPLESRGGLAYRTVKFIRRRWAPLTAAAAILAIGIFAFFQDLERRQLNRTNQELGTYIVEIFDEYSEFESPARVLDAILAKGQSIIEQRSLDVPVKTRAAFLGAAGRKLGRTDPEAAVPLLRECLELRRSHLPEGDRLIGKAANNLAAVLRGLGDYEGAKAAYLDARNVYESMEIKNLYEWGTVLGNLAGIEKDLGNTAEAVRLYEKARDIKGNADGITDRERAVLTRNLASGHRANKQFDEAHNELLLALETFVLPRDRATVQMMLGGVERERGNLQASQNYLNLAWELHQTYPETRATRLVHLWEQALLEKERGEFETAAEKLGGVLAQRREALSENHPTLGRTMVELADVYHHQGKNEEAIKLLDEALAIFRNRLPADHFRITRAEELRSEWTEPRP